MRKTSKKRIRRSVKKEAVALSPAQIKERTIPQWEGHLADVEDYSAGIADEASIKALMKDWRRGRATRTVWNMITDGYVALFSCAIVMAMIVSGLLSVQQSAAGCHDISCQIARHLLPLVAFFASICATCAAARLFGPVIASSAEGSWLLSAPMRRNVLLKKRLYASVFCAVVASSLLTALIAMLSGLALYKVGWWALLSAAGGGGVIALLAIAQAYQRLWPYRLIQTVSSVLLILTLIAVVASSRGWIKTVFIHRDALLIAGVFIVLTLAIAAVVIATFHLGKMPRSRLMSGSALLQGMQGAMFALDFSLMRDILVQRRWHDIGSVRPQSGRGVGRQALIMREILRLRRSPLSLVSIAISTVIPYALWGLGLGNLTWPLTAIVMMYLFMPLLGSMRVLARSKGLARCFPMSTRDINRGLSIIPALVAIIWTIAITPARLVIGQESLTEESLWHAFSASLITAIAGLIASMRWVTARSADYSTPMVATGFGALPPGLMINLIRGFDMVALITIPLILGWPSFTSALIAAIAYMVLSSGGISSEELAERNREAREELAALKEQKRKEAIVYHRRKAR